MINTHFHIDLVSPCYLQFLQSPGDKEPFKVHGQSLGDAESFSKIWGERIATLFLQKLSRFSARGVLTGDAYI